MSSVSALLLTRRRSIRALPLRRGDSPLQRVRHQFLAGLDRCLCKQNKGSSSALKNLVSASGNPVAVDAIHNETWSMDWWLCTLGNDQDFGVATRLRKADAGEAVGSTEYPIVMRGRSLEFIFQTGKMLTQ